MARWVHRRGLLSRPACDQLVAQLREADTDALELDSDQHPLVTHWMEASARVLEVDIFRRMSDIELHLLRLDKDQWEGPVSACWPEKRLDGVKVCGIVRLQGHQTHEFPGMATPALSLGDAMAWPSYLPYIVQPCSHGQERHLLLAHAQGREWR